MASVSTSDRPGTSSTALDVVDWLLAGDPAIRWQTMRDLTGAPADEVAAERARVETEGWGARLLSLRDADGLWAGGACFPRKVVDDWKAGIEPDFSRGQPWTSTLPVLRVLRDLGLDPASASARETTALVTQNARWEHDDQAFFDGEVEPCINGQTLAIGSWFGADVDGLVTGLLGEQLSTAAGTARPSGARRSRPSTRRSAWSRACWTTSASGGTIPVATPDDAVRSTCSSATCSVGAAPGRS